MKSKIHRSLFKKLIPVPDRFLLNELPEFESLQVIELRGTNGSGKSTLIKRMIEIDQNAYEFTDPVTRLVITCIPLFKTIAVGPYPQGRAVGGVDRISGSDKIEAAIRFAKDYQLQMGLECFDRLVFEGIMTSTSNTRWTDFVVNTLKVPQKDCWVCWANTPLQTCIERIYGRTGKEFNHDLVAGKFDQLTRQPANHAEQFPEVNRMIYDCMCEKDDMVETFINLSYKPVLS